MRSDVCPDRFRYGHNDVEVGLGHIEPVRRDDYGRAMGTLLISDGIAKVNVPDLTPPRRHRLLVSERVWKRAFEHRALSQLLAPLIAVRAKCLVARRGRRDHVTDERIVELKVGNNESGPQQHALVANFELDDRALI